MEFGNIYHRSSQNECYALNEEEICINLHTGYDVDRVWVCYGDPFDLANLEGDVKWSGELLEIKDKIRLKYHLLWSVILKPEFKRCKYYFVLKSENEMYNYLEDGFYNMEKFNRKGRMLQYFIFPWLNPADIKLVPEWVKDTVWYQIFPERFCNGNAAHNLPDTRPWKMEKARNEYYYRGDLEGIIQKLDYIKKIGFNGIYLNPIFLSDSTHKYDTTDYEIVDPAFGDSNILRNLVEEAHQRGIKIMLDTVFNHCGSKFKPWQDVLQKGKESKYFHWFMINQWPFNQNDWSTRDGKFYSFAFHGGMPKLNTNNPEVVEFLIHISSSWIDKYDIDGLRFDVGNEVSHHFLKKLRGKLKNKKPSIYLLGEVWHDSINWLQGDEYDSVMNYPLTASVKDFWFDTTQTKDDFEYDINRCYSLYMRQTNQILFNLLDSHDTDRLRSRSGNLDIFYQQLTVLMTLAGSPSIYYGTEIAMEGGHDPDCRRCMPWNEIEEGKYEEEITTFKQLLAIRMEHEACKSVQIYFTNTIADGRVIEYCKKDDSGNSIMVYLNCSTKAILVPVQEEILFARNYQDGNLTSDGTLILLMK